MPKKKRKHFRNSTKRSNKSERNPTSQPSNTQVISGKPSTNPREPPKKERSKSNIFTLFVFPACALVASNYGANMLRDISLPLSYLLWIIAFSVVFGRWIWIAVGYLGKKLKFVRTLQVILVIVIVSIITIYSPTFQDYFDMRGVSSKIPKFISNDTLIQVHYGSGEQAFWAQISVGELKQKEFTTPFAINGQDIFTLYIKDNELYIDTKLFTGIQDQEKHIFYKPATIKQGVFDVPETWTVNRDKYYTKLEILDQNKIPVLLMEYKSSTNITISGLFVTPMGICKVDNHDGSGFQLFDYVSQIGEYKVDKIFKETIFDFLCTERTYFFK